MVSNRKTLVTVKDNIVINIVASQLHQKCFVIIEQKLDYYFLTMPIVVLSYDKTA